MAMILELFPPLPTLNRPKASSDAKNMLVPACSACNFGCLTKNIAMPVDMIMTL